MLYHSAICLVNGQGKLHRWDHRRRQGHLMFLLVASSFVEGMATAILSELLLQLKPSILVSLSS